MAYAPDTNQDPNQNPQAPQNQPAPTTTSSAGPGVSKTPTSNVSSQVAGTNAPAQPFQNIGTYLTANAPQVQGEANTIAGNLGTQATQTNADVAKEAASTSAAITAGQPTLTSDQITKAASNPTAFVTNPSDVATFQSLYNATTPYSGPTSYSPSANVSGEVANAGDTAKQFNDFNGVESYLRSANPTGTAGIAALDTALLQGSPDTLKTLQTAAAPLANIPTTLATNTTAANKQAADARAAADAKQQELLAAFNGPTGAIPTFKNNVGNELKTAQAGLKTQADQLSKDFNNENLTPQELAQLGLTSDQWSAITGGTQGLQKDYGAGAADLTPFITEQDPSTVLNNPAATETPQDYATAAALAQLTGTDLSQYAAPTSPVTAPNIKDLLSVNAAGAERATTTALHDNDLALLSSLSPGVSGPDLLARLAEPKTLSGLQSQYGNTSKWPQIQDALTRLGFIAAPVQPGINPGVAGAL